MKEKKRKISANLGNNKANCFKGTGSRDRFEKIQRKLTGLGLKRNATGFYVFQRLLECYTKKLKKNIPCFKCKT